MYNITQDTKALLCQKHSPYPTIIYERNEQIKSKQRLIDILSHNCLQHGSSLNGRFEFAEETLGTKVKLPIIVNPEMGIFMVPIRSLRNESCGVLSYYQIKRYESKFRGTYIKFHDGTDTYIDISWRSFDQQFKKTSHLIAHHFRSKIFI